MAGKTTLRPDDWAILIQYQNDKDRSISRIFDEIQKKRLNDGLVGINRRWFIRELCHSICGAKDGKVGSRFHISNEIIEKYTEKTPEQVVTPVESEQVVESITEILPEEIRDKIIFCLSFLYHNKTESFNNIHSEGGYQKGMIRDVTAYLKQEGYLKNKNATRYEPLNWEVILKDFPEVRIPPVEHPEWKTTPKKSRVETPEEKSEEVEKTQVETPKKSKLELKLEKMEEWLLDETHPCDEVTKGEIVTELQRLRVENPWDEADKLLMKWKNEGVISNVRGTYAYKIIHSAAIPTVTEPKPDFESVLKFKAEETSAIEPIKNIEELPETTSDSIIGGKDLVIRCDGKDIRVVNKSNSSLSVTIEDGEVILTIK